MKPRELEALLTTIEDRTGQRALVVLMRDGEGGHLTGTLGVARSLPALAVLQSLATALAAFVEAAAPNGFDRDALLGALVPLFEQIRRIEGENPSAEGPALFTRKPSEKPS